MKKLEIKKDNNDITKQGKSLSQKAVRSGFWVFFLRIVQQLFNISRLVILARVLAPKDFGLMGIALLMMMILETFSQTGFREAIIQRKKDIQSYLDGAWTILVFRGLILFIILYLLAPYIAIFFEAPEAESIIQVIGVAIILQALTNIGIVYFEKELEFNKQFLYQFSGISVDFIVAISSVLIFRNVWALVFGLLAGNAAKCLVSYFIHPYRPKLTLKLGKTKDLFRFGKWILGSSILVFLITQGDDIFVGKLLGIIMLGFYQMAYRISNMPATEVTHVISQVTFPTFSKLQDNIPKLRDFYLKVLQLTAFLSFPIAGLIFIFATDFTRLFLGEKWMPMVPAMMILVFAGLIRSIAATSGPIFYAVGKPRIDTLWQIIRLIIIAILIFPFTIKWGITGTSFVVLLSIFISNIGFSYNVIKITRCEIKKYSKMIIFPFGNGMIMVSCIFILKKYLNPIGILEFILLVGFGILIYLIIMNIFDRYLNYKMQVLLKKSIFSFLEKSK